MIEIVNSLITAWQATSQLEVVSVLFGLAYIILAARENSWCWPAAFIGTGAAIFLFWDARLIMESALNVYYLLMAVYGGWQWQYGKRDNSPLQIHAWPWKNHLIVVAIIFCLTVLSGTLLHNNSQAALPYLDSFTTWSAVICTFMVARKILENWLYWIVIDAASVYLYLERGLYLYAALFVLYTGIAVVGYFHWRRSYQQQNQHSP